jgi:nicotinate-nucleotide--dimethylbenzimidazole phosphoribosyltransferase
MTSAPPLRAVLFDIGDTLVRAAVPGTPVAHLRAEPIGAARRELDALATSYRLGAVTDTTVMTERDVRDALSGTGLGELLEVIVTSVEAGRPKPDPVGLRLAMAHLGVAPEETLFVGDAPVDAAAAAAAGVAFAPVDGSAGEAVRAHLTARSGAFEAAARLVAPTDEHAARAARDHHGLLTKPAGSLGRLEDVGVQLAAIAGVDPPPRPRPAAVAVFAADHGVVAEGVSAWPQEVTAQMVANFVAGGAAVNVLAAQHDAAVTVVDVGVATDLGGLATGGSAQLRSCPVRRGTANLAREAAMTRDEARRALDVGAAIAHELVADGAAALVTGDMGIGNTTAAAALVAAFTGRTAAAVTGRGAGADAATLDRKVRAIESALARLDPGADALSILAEVGGLEIAALAGFVVGGASHRVPVVVDGVIADAALLVAAALCPASVAYAIAGHRSSEPGATAALGHLHLDPLLDLGLRLGEGSGAVAALPLVDSAALVLAQMATFDAAGVDACQA